MMTRVERFMGKVPVIDNKQPIIPVVREADRIPAAIVVKATDEDYVYNTIREFRSWAPWTW